MLPNNVFRMPSGCIMCFLLSPFEPQKAKPQRLRLQRQDFKHQNPKRSSTQELLKDVYVPGEQFILHMMLTTQRAPGWS